MIFKHIFFFLKIVIEVDAWTQLCIGDVFLISWKWTFSFRQEKNDILNK